MWAAPTWWYRYLYKYTEYDGCMRWGCWRAAWGVTQRRIEDVRSKLPDAGKHAQWPYIRPDAAEGGTRVRHT
jgi:hypothetical protein